MNKRILAIVLTFLMVIGFMPEVKAAEIIKTAGRSTEESTTTYDAYDIEFDSNGTRHIKSSELRVIDGQMKIVTTFANGSMIDINSIKVNGKKSKSQVKDLDVENDELTVETVINSLDDEININMTVTVPQISMVHTYDIYIKDIKLADNTYNLDSESNGTKYMKSNVLEVENGEMTLVTTFNMASMIKLNYTTVNSEEVEVESSYESNNTLIIRTSIDSLNDEVNFNMTITVPMIMTATHDLYLKNMRLPGVEIKEDAGEDIPEEDEEETPETPGIPEEIPGDDNNSGDNNDNNDNEANDKVLQDGNYTIESKILKTGTTQESLASSYIEKVSSLKVENGQYYLTLGIKDMSVLSNIGSTIDGEKTDVTSVDNGDGTGTLTFKVNSLSSNVLISCRITVPAANYVSDVDFNVSLDKSTLKDEDGNEVDSPNEEVTIPTNKDASYTIENEISSITGSTEVAGIISPNSTISVESGKIYLGITFYKSGFMDGRLITLNNNTAPARYSIEEDTSNKVTVKINISSLSDEIKFSSKNKSIDDAFTLRLLQDTLKEQTSSSTGGSSNSGSSSDDDDDDDDTDLDDGTYLIKNKTLKEDSNDESHAREYLDKESVITVKNGKIYLTLKFTHGKMMSDTSIKVEGKKTSYTTVKKSGNQFYIKFKIGALDDEILVTTTIDTGIASIGKHEGIKFRVVLRESTLDEDDDADDYDDDEDDDDDTESSTSTGTTAGTTNGTVSGTTDSNTVVPNSGGISSILEPSGAAGSYKRDTYSVKNDIITDSAIGYNAARGAIGEDSYMVVEDGKNYMIVNFTQMDAMNNIRLAIDNNNIDYDILKAEGNSLTVKFEIPSVSTPVDVTATIAMMGRDTSFGLKFIESTLTHIGTEESDSSFTESSGGASGGSSSVLNNILSTSAGSSTSGLSQGSAQGGSIKSTGSSNTSAETAVLDNESVEAKEYYKKYTIENEIVSDSMMGRTMARKYLNTVSTLDEVDGQLYLTLTFSGVESMDNFTFAVNGENREYSSAGSNDIKSFKFKIDSVNDSIAVGIYVKPMKMNINFGVKLNEGTMVLIDEGEISAEGEEVSDSESGEEFLQRALAVQDDSSKNNSELSVMKIALATSLMTTGMNGLLAGIIYLIIKRKKKKKDSKKENID